MVEPLAATHIIWLLVLLHVAVKVTGAGPQEVWLPMVGEAVNGQLEIKQAVVTNLP